MTFLAYIITFFVAPLIGGLASIFLIFIDSLFKMKIPISGIVGMIIAVWVGRWIFSMFGLPPTIGIALILGLGSITNSINRLRKRADYNEISSSIGELVGIIIGTFIFL